MLDFVSINEELELLQQLDEVPWDVSQSGRCKQVRASERKCFQLNYYFEYLS